MLWNSHSRLAGQHAVLSASNNAWSNYDEDKMVRVFMNMLAAKRGTELHALAHDLIRLGIKLPRTNQTLNAYVNDMIGMRMTPEQILYYSDLAFGTADGVNFNEKKRILKIADLKTGENKTSVRQLEIYAAYFCLEYHWKPYDLEEIELRIYQNDEIRIYQADPGDIVRLMDQIVHFDKVLSKLKSDV